MLMAMPGCALSTASTAWGSSKPAENGSVPMTSRPRKVPRRQLMCCSACSNSARASLTACKASSPDSVKRKPRRERTNKADPAKCSNWPSVW
jgi:hypothetical protein